MMAITKNPIYYLWVGAIGRFLNTHKAWTASAVFLCLGALVIWIALARERTPTSPPAQVVDQARSTPVRPDCPQVSETLTLQQGEERIINPRYCQLRWKIRFGCFRIFDSGGGVIAPNACPGSELSVPSGIYKVVALQPARLTRTECPRGSRGENLNTCD